jgi:PAS domain S-box-containing protein
MPAAAPWGGGSVGFLYIATRSAKNFLTPMVMPSSSVRNKAVAERPDGTRVPFLAYPTPLWDDAGTLTGAVNTLIDITERKEAERVAQRFAAIVESSGDAILSKDLNGTITTLNHGAERLFGYTAEELIGKPVIILIPPDRHDEETLILDRIRRGECIDHYETIRRHKDGSLIEISLTVSPIKDANGRIIGASKIARDITERRRSQERQKLLLREMNHRVKNLFALAGGVVTLSARTAGTPKELAGAVRERLAALARAHELTLLDHRSDNNIAGSGSDDHRSLRQRRTRTDYDSWT